MGRCSSSCISQVFLVKGLKYVVTGSRRLKVLSYTMYNICILLSFLHCGQEKMNQTLARLRKVSPSLSCLFWADIKVTQQLLIWERPEVGMITTTSLLTLSEMCFVSYEWLDSVRWLLLLAWAFGRRTRWEFSIDINTQAWIKWFKPSSVSISTTAFDWQDFDLHNLFLHPHQSATWDMNWQSWESVGSG